MKWLPPAWRKVIVLAAVFVVGMLFDDYVVPFMYRDVGVWTIRGQEGHGCGDRWGATLIRFGQGIGQVDGEYQFPCGEFSLASDTVALYCNCNPRR